jgi:hypothetical protein
MELGKYGGFGVVALSGVDGRTDYGGGEGDVFLEMGDFDGGFCGRGPQARENWGVGILQGGLEDAAGKGGEGAFVG